MASTIRIKRSTGSAAPATLANAELAYTEGGGGTLYIGVGNQGQGGSATQVVAIGGPGTYATTASLSSYVTSSSLNSTLGSYVTSSNLTTTLGSYATTAALNSAIQTVVGAAPAVLDTLAELASALGSDANFSTTITTSLSGKLAKANNLNDVQNVTLARGSLGLGSLSLQAANNVAITGGTIDGVTIDGGTW